MTRAVPTKGQDRQVSQSRASIGVQGERVNGIPEKSERSERECGFVTRQSGTWGKNTGCVGPGDIRRISSNADTWTPMFRFYES